MGISCSDMLVLLSVFPRKNPSCANVLELFHSLATSAVILVTYKQPCFTVRGQTKSSSLDIDRINVIRLTIAYIYYVTKYKKNKKNDLPSSRYSYLPKIFYFAVYLQSIRPC